MQDHTKTKLAEILNKSDAIVREAYYAGEDDTYRWFCDKLQELKADKELVKTLIMLFVVERGGFPSREDFKKHYEESLANLVKNKMG